MARVLLVICFLALTTARSTAWAQNRYTVAVISDLNGPYGSTEYSEPVHSAIDLLTQLRPDLVLSTGDMVAGQKASLSDAKVRAMWRGFHRAVSDPLQKAAIPFAVTPGNHDASGYVQFARDRRIFGEQWTARKPKVDFVDAAGYPFRYAFRLGPALFVSLDDTVIGPLSSGQRAWLDRVLTQNADVAIKIVFGHVPLYPFAQGREKDFLGDTALETLLKRHGVAAFISGHHHAYFPGQKDGLRLVGMACLGDGPRKLIGQSKISEQSFVLIRIAESPGDSPRIESTIESIEAYTPESYPIAVPRESLPSSIGRGSQRLQRDDIL